MLNELHVYLFQHVKRINLIHEFPHVYRIQLIFKNDFQSMKFKEIFTYFEDRGYYPLDSENIEPFRRREVQMYLNLPEDK